MYIYQLANKKNNLLTIAEKIILYSALFFTFSLFILITFVCLFLIKFLFILIDITIFYIRKRFFKTNEISNKQKIKYWGIKFNFFKKKSTPSLNVRYRNLVDV